MGTNSVSASGVEYRPWHGRTPLVEHGFQPRGLQPDDLGNAKLARAPAVNELPIEFVTAPNVSWISYRDANRI